MSKTKQKIVALTNEKSIANFTNDEYIKLEGNLQQWSRFLGVKEPLEDDQAQMFVIFLSENFGSLSPKEITNALMMGLSGDLGVDMEHYNTFSSVYLSRVLRAYTLTRNRAVMEYREQVEEYVANLDKPDPKLKAQLIAQTMKKSLSEHIAKFEEQGKKWGTNEDEFIYLHSICLMYDFLTSNGLATPIKADEDKIKPSQKIAYLRNKFQKCKENGINYPERICAEIRQNYEKTQE